MDKQSNSTTVPPSIGELSENIVAKLAERVTIDDIQVEMSCLTSLLEAIDDQIYEVCLREPTGNDLKKIGRAQNLVSVALHFGRHIDAQIDAFQRGKAQ